MSKQTWSERFSEPTSELMHRFNSSLSFDQRLAACDIQASIAHARMLGDCEIISTEDSAAIIQGLEAIANEIKDEKFSFDPKYEDVHMALEAALTARIGEAGKRLHTARSRNDQVSTDLRLWLRAEIDNLQELVKNLRRGLLETALEHTATIMPGMTHLQIAQPTTLAHHLHAYATMLGRDVQRLAQARERTNLLPLGAAAFAGTSFPINPEAVAQELEFAGLCPNTMDAVADRDFAIETVFACSLLMVHLSRLCEEIILWSSQPFGFVTVGDAFATGSSIMPQKRNPDAAELIRSKTGRAVGQVVALLMQGKAQPLAYNKDNQEDKEALFDSLDTTRACVEVMTGMLASCTFHAARMREVAEAGFATATDLADFLVRQGVAFRDAYATVAQMVAKAEAAGTTLAGLDDATLAELTEQPVAKLREVLAVDQAVQTRTGFGAPAQLAKQIQAELAELN